MSESILSENEKNESKELGFDLHLNPTANSNPLTTSITSDTSINQPPERLVELDNLLGIPIEQRSQGPHQQQQQDIQTPLSFTPGTVNVELGNLISLTDGPSSSNPLHSHQMTSSGGSLSDICEGSTPPTDSPRPTHHRSPSDGSMQQLAPNLNKPTHHRSPSDESLRHLTAPTHKTHKRTPSDISLRTMAAIRGTYHKRTASDVAMRSRTHQRSSSDGMVPLLGSPQKQGHQRTTSNGSNTSELLDVGEAAAGKQQCSVDIGDDLSLLSAGEIFIIK